MTRMVVVREDLPAIRQLPHGGPNAAKIAAGSAFDIGRSEIVNRVEVSNSHEQESSVVNVA